jgi:hypothetical protein
MDILRVRCGLFMLWSKYFDHILAGTFLDFIFLPGISRFSQLSFFPFFLEPCFSQSRVSAVFKTDPYVAITFQLWHDVVQTCYVTTNI